MQGSAKHVILNSELIAGGAQSGQQAVMVDPTGQQNTTIKSIKSGLPEGQQPAPIAVYSATPFNANDPASSKQPIVAPGTEDKTDFKYFQRQVSHKTVHHSSGSHSAILHVIVCRFKLLLSQKCVSVHMGIQMHAF